MGSWIGGGAARQRAGRSAAHADAREPITRSGCVVFLEGGGGGVWESSKEGEGEVKGFIAKAVLAGSATGWQLSHGAHD